MKYENHSFYCMKCGNKGLDIPRRVSHKHGKHHRKKLWCIYCKQEVNHIECKTLQDVEEFKEKFAAGEYKEEAMESLAYIEKENQAWS